MSDEEGRKPEDLAVWWDLPEGVFLMVGFRRDEAIGLAKGTMMHAVRDAHHEPAVRAFNRITNATIAALVEAADEAEQ